MPRRQRPPHSFLSISAGSGCWKGERLLSCFVDDPTERWGQCAKRILELEVTGVAGLLLRSLVALSPRKRASVYRLRYGDGYSTIVRVQWHEGGINSEAPLDNAYVEAIVSVVPIPKDRQEVMPADIEPHKSVLSCLESIDGLRSQRCSLSGGCSPQTSRP